MKFDKIVPDTSIIIEGLLSKNIGEKKLSVKKIIIHEAVLAELESQANKNRETGLIGLEEIGKIRELAKTGFEIEYKGNRPGDFEIKFAKSGEIDSLIRELASKENATLVTADKVQAEVAKAKGIDVFLYEFPEKELTLKLEKYFDSNTMSLHIRQDCSVKAKKGSPGEWVYEEISKESLSLDEVKDFYEDVIENARMRKDSFVESERKGSMVLQVGTYRLVLCKPPFSDAYEITAVKPIKTLKLEEYGLSDKLQKRLLEKTEGILIAGAPGQGKSTFVQALAMKYLELNKSVRTIEMPRDLVVPDEISQYSLSHGSSQELHDVLLLSRPDYTFFDELRSGSDFGLFKDLRLSGIGMAGVIHATEPIDAIQRFVGKIELGMIPHVIDTVVFIEKGSLRNVFSVDIDVKVPSGMTDSDLARPVVVVHDFETGALKYEIYSYGEETVVIPVRPGSKISASHCLAEKYLRKEFSRFDEGCRVEMLSDNEAQIEVVKDAIPAILGKNGSTIGSLEEKYGVRLKVRARAKDKTVSEKTETKFSIEQTTKDLILKLSEDDVDKSVEIYVADDFLMSAKVSKKAQIKLSRNSTLCKVLLDAIDSEKSIKVLS